MMNAKKQLSSSQIIMIGFAGAILLGSLILMLPFATRCGQSAPFEDALFTATSAVCVTGLVVHDTAAYWSPFGQAVILLLIQIGGMGVMTVAVMITIASGRRVSLKERSTQQEAISAHQLGGIVPLTGWIVRMTLLFELTGAVLMAPVFAGRFGIGRGAWYALFHSVSAFCNAGFDLMGIRKPYSSLTGFSSNVLINAAVMLLIIIGGIGFLTWDDIRIHRLQVRKYRMQSKVILTTTALLLLLPALYFFWFEFSGLPLGERLLESLFQSVTPRTAGFNTADLNHMSENGRMLMILLMLIGGAPGSTAGGMKVTTLAVLLATSGAVFRKQEDTRFFGRRIPESVVRTAAAVITMYLVLFLTGGLVISRLERLPLLSCLYETASALGTVGLTLGITPTLGLISRGILVALMYIGRVGGLTLIFSAALRIRERSAKLPEGRLTVG